MPRCLLRIVINATPPDEREIELRRLIEIPESPMIGTDLRPVANNHRNTAPLTVRRILGGPDDERLVIDLDDVRGDFETLAGEMLTGGWRPHLEFPFDDEQKARRFAEDHADTLIRMGGKLYSVDSAALWCLDKSVAVYERVALLYERN